MRQAFLWLRGGRGLSLLSMLWVLGGSAHAQDRPGVAILRTATAGELPSGLGGTIDRALRARVASLGTVDVRGSVALDLADVQLALGCEGEAPTCLSAVAAELGARYLILPNLDRAGSQIVLSVGLFDAETQRPRRVDRRVPSDDPGRLLDVIDELLHELFGAPAVASPPMGTEPPPGTTLDGGGLAGASIVAGFGVLALAVGIGLGVASLDEGAQYAQQPTGSEDEAARAEALYRSASDLALGANVLFVAGGVALVTAAVALAVTLVNGGPPEAPPVSAFFTPGGGGLVLSGSFGGAR